MSCEPLVLEHGQMSQKTRAFFIVQQNSDCKLTCRIGGVKIRVRLGVIEIHRDYKMEGLLPEFRTASHPTIIHPS